jgi:hypothetical protein
VRLRYHFATWLTVMATHPGLQTAEPLSPSIPGPSSVVIVELFTSEGCSSCPPADSLLRQVHLKETSAGQLIVGISEHVTYWNNLGWKDPYSSQVFTDRQGIYASRLSPEGPYTPQMVVNGREQFVGSDGGTLERALADAGRRAHIDLRILSSAPSASALDVRFAVSGSFSKPLDIVAVLADDADRSNVLRGENNGRLLQHVSVARTLNVVATVWNSGEESFRLHLPDGFQNGTAGGHHLILFAQEPHQGAIVGGATIPL